MAKNSILSILSPARILTHGWAFVFFFAAILSISTVSFAEIVGFEDFDGNKSGWDWDNTGTAQEWSNLTTETDSSGNTRAKIVNRQAYLAYGSSGSLSSGTFAYTFDMEIGVADNQWGGLSLYNGSTEMNFFGSLAKGTDNTTHRTFDGTRLSLRNVPSSNRTDDETAESYLNTNKTYAVVTNSTGMYAWAYDLGTELKYEDLFTTPTVQVPSALAGNTRFRLGTSGTMYFDNIKMAYSDTSTIASKGDASQMSSLTDIFGPAPTVTCIKESFSKYESGSLVGQLQKNVGQAPVTKWTGVSGPAIDVTKNLDYPGWSSETGVLNVSGSGNGAVMTLDYNVMADWGLLGTDGLIGGAGVTNTSVYYGFLMQQVGDSGRWNMGGELYRNGQEVLGMSYHDWTSYDNIAGVFYDSNRNRQECRLNFTNDPNDNDIHLFVVKLTFGEDGTGDDAYIYIDPNMSLSEDQQDTQHVYRLSDMVGSSSLDLSFDNIAFRGAREYTFDEFRLAQTWAALADPAPGELYYYANTDDITADTWTIDGTSKLGVKFLEGDNSTTFAGGVALNSNGDFEIGAGKNLTLSGVVSGNGALTKTGAGTLTMTKANTYQGGTTISAGTLKLSGSGTLGTGAVTVNENATLEFAHESEQTVSNGISGAGSVAKTGSGKLTLSGENTYSGETTVSGGTLLVPSGATLSTSQVTVESGGTFQTGVSLTFQTGESLAYTPVNIDGGTFVVGDTSASKIISVSSLSLDGGTICLDLNDSSNDDADWLVASSASLKSGIIDLTFNNDSETDWWNLIKTYDEGFSLINGTITNFDNMQVYVNGAPTESWDLYAAPSNVMLIAVDAPSDPWYYANTNDINANSWTIDGTNKKGVQFKEGSVHSQTFVNPVHMSAAGSFDIGSGYDLTISGVIDGSGAVTKIGAGTLTLSANNTYSGGTTISEGTLKLTDGGTLGSGNVTNNANLEIATNAGMDFSKAVSGSGTLTKTGTGVLRYSGAGTYSGGTIISEGAIRWDAGGELGTGPITLATANTDLRFSGGLTKTISNDISGPGKLTKQGASGSPTVTLEGNLSGFTGTLVTNESNGNRSATIKLKGNNTNLVNASEVINNGTIDVSEYTGSTTMQLNKLSGAGNLKIGSNAIILNNAENANTTFSGVISGSGSVTKTGAGTMTLSGANTYTGATTVSGGTLLVPSGAALSTSQVAVESGGTFQTGTNLVSTNVTLNGGSFVLGTGSSAANITIADFALNGGTVNFDFYAAMSATNYDYLFTNAANLTSGAININFANNDEQTWWNNTSDGYVLIDTLGISGSLDNIQLLVNSAQTSNWYLDTTGNYIVMKKQNETPPVVEPYYYANTTDITADNWTIDGTDKLGAKFVEGGDAATFAGSVTLDANGEFEIGTGHNLTVSGAISGEGALTKTGEGTLTLSGDNTYTGGTTVSGGTLLLTKTGIKGTLATGSTVTVDGATSVLAGHGDILGYSDQTVGTINLQNGGTLHNDSTGDHITVGAVINMNNGIISAEDGWGNGTFGNFVFDNAINVTGGTDNAITANKITLRQYSGTPGNGGGKITVAEGAKLTISSQIAAHDSPTLVPLVKLGDGELVLSGDCTYTTGTYVNEGTLRLTKEGQKGTLATGSTVTVDGATSVLAGHGDILGYSRDTVGTVNLQNGGTLHNDATADQKAHITVGAAVNMNNGYITADPAAQGSDTYGNYVFDNAINVLGGTDNAITANQISLRQYDGTPGNAGGKITVADGAKLTISSLIKDPNAYFVPLVKQGAGTLTLSGDNTYTKGTNVSEGILQLTGDAVKANSSVEIAQNATLEYNVASGEKALDFTTSNTTVSGNGNVLKSGTGKLKIKADGEQFSADKFAVSAGELDFKGQYNGDLNVQRGATLSPGNSVGDLTVYGDVTIDAGATGLFEFSAYNEDPAQQSYDTLTIGNDGAFVIDENSIIKLFFEGNDASLWAAEGAQYKLVSDEGFVADITDMSDLLGNYTSLFGLEGRTDGLYLIGLGVGPTPEPGSGVPEPSTWALLALGVLALLLRKRVRN